jgi:8-oxo-dGTP diphosphatase
MIDVVCGILWNEGGEFLACRRAAGKHLGGLWEFPGGKVEPSESHAAALSRELREELGVSVTVGEALAPVVWEYPGKTIRLLPYHCRASSGEMQAMEHAELRWCSTNTARALDWADVDRSILCEIFAVGSP